MNERKATLSLAAIFSFRMLGLFMVLPVFALYAHTLPGVTPTLIGVALGIYGLTQACLQIPLGMLSDRIGRKPIIAAGLCVFALGSAIAAMSHGITGIIIGRAIQGAGAIGSTTLALLSDLTKEQNRTKAMAVVGMTIGFSFSIAMVLGPTLNALIGVPGIFWLTACLGLFGTIILFARVPKPPRLIVHRDTEAIPALFKSVLNNTELLRLDIGILISHAVMTAIFIAIPMALVHLAHMKEAHQWMLYLPVLLLSFVIMVPAVIVAEKFRKIKTVFLIAIASVMFSQLLLLWHHASIISIAFALFVFFTGFNILEASLPSLVSKITPAGGKGTAMGVYSTSQFFGIFLGGVIGGWMFSHFHYNGVFAFCSAATLLWLIIASTMKQPPHLATHMLRIGQIDEARARQLSAKLCGQPGVADAMIDIDTGIAYLKIDNTMVNKEALTALVSAV